MNKIFKSKLFYIILVFIICPLIVGIILKYIPSSKDKDASSEHFNGHIEDKSELFKNNTSTIKKKISSLTYSEINETLRKTPPLQRDEIRNSFKKIRVSWDVYFISARKEDNNKVYLSSTVSREFFNIVSCEVSLDDYPELAILREGAKMKITGEILEVDEVGALVTLTNVEIVF